MTTHTQKRAQRVDRSDTRILAVLSARAAHRNETNDWRAATNKARGARAYRLVAPARNAASKSEAVDRCDSNDRAEGYEQREPQVEMAAGISRAFNNGNLFTCYEPSM